jgi:glutaredoxin 3
MSASTRSLALTLLLGLLAVASASVPLDQTSRPSTALQVNPLQSAKFALVKSLAGPYDAVAVRKRLDSLIKDNSVLMLSFTTCPFCIKAKSILSEYPNLKYTLVELDQDPQGKAIRAELSQVIERTSVPAIWISQNYIGGCNDGGPDNGGLNALHQSKRLEGLLKQAKAI